MENSMVKVFENEETSSLVVIADNEAVVSSRNVADRFGKSHNHIMRDIQTLEKDVSNFGQMFKESTMPDSYGRAQRVYLMNRDGFTLLAMGFTGKEALQWKLKYMEAFNKMEQMINQRNIPKTYTEALRAYADEVDARAIAESKVAELAPKGEVYDKVMSDTDLLSMAQVAQFINIEGFGQNKLFEFLRKHGVLMESRRRLEKNRPYQQYVNQGWFVVRDIKTDEFTNSTTYVTQKGAEKILDLVYKYNGELDDILYIYHQTHKKARRKFRERFFGEKVATTLNVDGLQESMLESSFVW